jgi:hypothetical protein
MNEKCKEKNSQETEWAKFQVFSFQNSASTGGHRENGVLAG